MVKESRQQDWDGPIHIELIKERKNCQFNQEELTNLLDGSKDKTEQRRTIEQTCLNNKEIVDNEIVLEELGAQDRYEYDVKRNMELFKLGSKTGNVNDFDQLRKNLAAGSGSIACPDGSPLALHFVMFIPTLLGQATPEQKTKWLTRALNLEIIGTYAQTELGHGTFIRGLETTAIYDKNSEEFILHSPSLTAYKWWPGGLGKTANYAVVMAQLVIDDKKLGPHPFIVQLRCEDTHKPLPGIKIGAIGAKLGMNSNDNGFLGFENVRIPRNQLLMKNAQVEKDGTYLKPAQDKLSYGTMVYVRCFICADVSTLLRQAVTIATRYSAVRRQSELRPGEKEAQIIDYKTQQYKLFPALAMSISFSLVAHKLIKYYENSIQCFQEGNFDLMPELHGVSCGLKALITQESADAIDTVRRACGGHGFMISSNLPRLWGLSTAACTYEGENTVLLLQVARYLVKIGRLALSDPTVKLPESFDFMRDNNDAVEFDCKSTNGCVNLFAKVVRSQLKEAIKNLDRMESTNMDKSDCWNNCSIELSNVALAYCRHFVMKTFADVIKTSKLSENLSGILIKLFQIQAIYWILRFSGDFLRHGEMTSLDLEKINNLFKQRLSEIRIHAVNIVDSFDFPDALLKSTLGSYDGQVYERLYKSALKSQINQKDVPDAYWKYLKPFMSSKL